MKKKEKQKRYRVIYFKKHYIHKYFLAESKEQATSLGWGDCPNDMWVDTVEEIK